MSTRTDRPRVVGSLSPSRAGDFLSCPLLFRYRTIDRFPERSSPEAVRGTLVHRVLEEIFDLPAAERTPAASHALLEPAWVALQETSAQAREVALTLDEPTWLDSAHEALDHWFTLEDPRRLEPVEREALVETVLDSGLAVRGIVDRLDATPEGRLRVVDYKVARSPAVGFEGRALFQLRVYGLILWRTRGVVPERLQLVYLLDSDVVGFAPDEAALLATERKLNAIWDAVTLARETGEFEPSPGRQCDWCSFHELCPTFGGTVPPMPPPPNPPSLWARLSRRLRRRWRRARGLWRTTPSGRRADAPSSQPSPRTAPRGDR